MESVSSIINGKKDPRPLAGGLDSIAGSISTLTPSEQAEVNSETPPTAAPATPILSNADVMAALVALNKKLDNKDQETAALKQLVQKQADELAAKSFYEHQIGGRGGSDPLTDDSLKVEDLADGRQRVWIAVYSNLVPKKGRVNKVPLYKDGKQVMHNGKPVMQDFTNWDLGRTTIRSTPLTVRTRNGDVTLQGIAILNVGRQTTDEVVEAANRRDATDKANDISEKEVVETPDGPALAGSDSNGDGTDAT